MKVAVLASGQGTNLQALIDRLHGRGVEIVAVASDQAGAAALGRAEAAGIPGRVFALADYADRGARDAAMDAWLRECGAELVVLAGYMAILTGPFVASWSGRLVNVHPSLLPAFPGVRAMDQALDYGVKVFGVTVHLVDEGVDTGPILLQRAVELPGARTADEVHDALRPHEHELLCAAVTAFAEGRVRADPEHPRRMVVLDAA